MIWLQRIVAWSLAAATLSMMSPRAATSAEPTSPVADTGLERVVQPLVREFCVRCHGPTKQEAELRLDQIGTALRAPSPDVDVWRRVFDQLRTAAMPPPQSPRPTAARVDEALRALHAAVAAVGVELEDVDAMAFPIRGNYVDHDLLFNQPSQAAPATPARIWRLSPYGYREFVDSLTQGRLIVQGGPAVRAKMNAIVTTPFGLSDDPGFRDYAFRYQVSGSETQQLALNARIVLDAIISKRQRYTPPRELASLVETETAPTLEQIRTAVLFLFKLTLLREPTAEELTRYADNVQSGILRMGNRDGLIHGLVPVLLHPEAIFRNELGGGKPDRFGRPRRRRRLLSNLDQRKLVLSPGSKAGDPPHRLKSCRINCV